MWNLASTETVWFQLGRIPESGDQPRVGVLVCLSRSIQLIEQPSDIGAPDHFPNHPGPETAAGTAHT
jgi:hypothetical protein